MMRCFSPCENMMHIFPVDEWGKGALFTLMLWATPTRISLTGVICSTHCISLKPYSSKPQKMSNGFRYGNGEIPSVDSVRIETRFPKPERQRRSILRHAVDLQRRHHPSCTCQQNNSVLLGQVRAHTPAFDVGDFRLAKALCALCGHSTRTSIPRYEKIEHVSILGFV